MDEFERIDKLIAPLARGHAGTFDLTNDAAVFQPATGNEVVLTKDMMAEGVHFLRDDPPDRVARKLLRTNLSDLAAMGATARGYLLGLGLDGDRDEGWLKGFFDGLAQDQRCFDVVLLGGDTISVAGGVLTLSLTAVGEIEVGRALTRSGAAPGDCVGISGTVGDGALGLLACRGELDIPQGSLRDALVDRYRLPRPRMALGRALVGVASAALDVSDGLLADAGHIARRSQVAIALDWPGVPLSDAAREALRRQPDLRTAVVSGGDDYELLFTVAEERWPEIEAASRASATPLARIGRCVEGSGVTIRDAQGVDFTPVATGWRHGASP